MSPVTVAKSGASLLHILLQRCIRTKSLDDAHAEGFIQATRDHAGIKLKRSLGLFSVTMIGVGSTIGTGIFFNMVQAVPKAGPSIVLSFLLAAITAGLTALCYAELAARIPAAGSSYSFAYATVGEFAAFLMAACLLLEYGLGASASAIGWSAYLDNFLLNAFHWQIPVSLRLPTIVCGANGVEIHLDQFNLPPLVLTFLCGGLLARGTEESATTNTIFVIVKLILLAFFVVVAFSGFDARNFVPFFNPDNSKGYGGLTGVIAGAGTVFFSFIGLDTVACTGEELRNPKRNIPLGIVAALIIVTVTYLVVSIAALGAQPAAKFQGQQAGLAVIMQTVTGRTWPGLVISAGAVFSVFAVMLVALYGLTRVLFAISSDGLLPKAFCHVNARTQTPIKNTAIVCVVVGVAAALVDADFLWDMVSMGTLAAFSVISVAVPVLRHKTGEASHSGFRVPLGPYVVPSLSIGACLFIMKDLSKTTIRVFAAWMAAAVLIYLLYAISDAIRTSRRNAIL
jgi:basic amino acid/polyamine antiporter, APA family